VDNWRSSRPTATGPAKTPQPAPAAAPPSAVRVPPVVKDREPEEPRSITPIIKPEDKWDGEDENADDGSVKDNWDDEDEEVPPPQAADSGVAKVTDGVKAIQVKSKKGKIKKKLENRVYDQEEDERTPAEIEAYKMREEKAREAEELRLTKEAFGIPTDKNELLDIINPITKDDFDGLRKKIIEDLDKFSKRSPYQDFVEELIVDLSVCLPAKRLKKVKTSIEVLYFEKTKSEKVKPGVNAAGKTASSKGIKLNVEGDRAILKQRDDDYDDFDDFM